MNGLIVMCSIRLVWTLLLRWRCARCPFLFDVLEWYAVGLSTHGSRNDAQSLGWEHVGFENYSLECL
jgi:hypothetical protein